MNDFENNDRRQKTHTPVTAVENKNVFAVHQQQRVYVTGFFNL